MNVVNFMEHDQSGTFKMTTISITDLEVLCADVLSEAGLREAEIQETIAHYIENEMCGKASHGVIRVIESYKALKKEGITDLNPKMEVDNGSMVSINAQRRLAPLACNYATQTAMKRAKIHGIAMVGIHNYIGSAGAMSYYLRRITEDKKLAIMGCNSNAMVAAPEGKDPLIGTNPVGIGIPAYEDNAAIIADFATTELAYGKIAVMDLKGQDIPHGLMIDKDGNPSNDPEDAFEGAMLPFAGYKGFSLGLMVEMLAAFVGATPHNTDSYTYKNDGLFIIALDPAKMYGEQYLRQVSKSLSFIHTSAPLPNTERVSVPGDRAAEALKTALDSGTVDVPDETLEKLNAIIAQEAA